MIRLAMADDDPIVRKHLSRALTASGDIDVVATVPDGEALLEVLSTTAVDVVLVDVEMPGIDGIETTKKIKEDFPNIPVLILTAFEKEDRLGQALAVGAAGFLTKDVSPDDLPPLIKDALAGNTVMGSRPSHILLEAYRNQAIRREQDKEFVAAVESLDANKRAIFSLLIVGLSNQQIASQLNLTHSTVRTYTSRIFDITKCESRTRLAVRAIGAGLE
ncbi:MAG: response regulator transcription factor [Ancrocorticia sp.]